LITTLTIKDKNYERQNKAGANCKFITLGMLDNYYHICIRIRVIRGFLNNVKMHKNGKTLDIVIDDPPK